jgi:molybdopterin synthase catalytic subunit
MFRFADNQIDVSELRRQIGDDAAGAVVVFEGIVRNHNEGKQVTALEYEAYESLGYKEGAAIIDEAKEKFAIIAASCVHRTGVLSVGDMAVVTLVSAAHRVAAFDACRYIIDEVKTRLPVWKKETYTDGTSGWVNCKHSELANQVSGHD